MSLWNDLKKPYADIRELLSRYWRNYGGWKAFWFSPYFHLSLVIGVCTFPYDYSDKLLWWDLPIGVLPSLIGFSLGGYAIFLAFGDEKFKQLISGDSVNKEPSPYLIINTTFLHFIMVQISALILAVVAKSTNVKPEKNDLDFLIYGYGVISYVGFIYALFLALATTIALYRLISLHDKHLSSLDKQD